MISSDFHEFQSCHFHTDKVSSLATGLKATFLCPSVMSSVHGLSSRFGPVSQALVAMDRALSFIVQIRHRERESLFSLVKDEFIVNLYLPDRFEN